jgi:hypothetical protein
MSTETRINGFEVAFYDYEESNNVTVIKGEYSGSLALLQHLGGLEDANGNVLDVTPAIINKIETWAIAQGY